MIHHNPIYSKPVNKKENPIVANEKQKPAENKPQSENAKPVDPSDVKPNEPLAAENGKLYHYQNNFNSDFYLDLFYILLI